MGLARVSAWTSEKCARSIDWGAHHRVFYCETVDGYDNDKDVRAMADAGLLHVDEGVAYDGGLCWGADVDRLQALDDHIEAVLSGLVDYERKVLALLHAPKPLLWGAAVGQAFEVLNVRGLVYTNLGRELARRIRENP